jgi:hypothetical protein
MASESAKALFAALGSGVLAAAPATVLELSAGSGELSIALAEAWAGSVRRYVATDAAHNVAVMRALFALGEGVLQACAVVWGQSYDFVELLQGTGCAAFDVLLGADVLDGAPLGAEGAHAVGLVAATLASLCSPGNTTALLCHRERCAQREAAFGAALQQHGFVVERTVVSALSTQEGAVDARLLLGGLSEAPTAAPTLSAAALVDAETQRLAAEFAQEHSIA